jgi:ankyrin repeat protein
LDLAAYCNHKNFIQAILDRSTEKLNENVLNLKELIGNSSALNFMHYACIWGSYDVCRYLAELGILMSEPVDQSLAAQQQSNIDNNNNKTLPTSPSMKTIGSILLKQRTRSGETGKELARRYGHEDIVNYLEYSG